MVLIHFLRSLVGINAVWKSLIRAFKRYRVREENSKSDWERMVWTFECRFVDQCSYDGLGILDRLPVAAAKADFVKPSENLIFLTTNMYRKVLEKIFRQLCPVKHAFYFFLPVGQLRPVVHPKAKKWEKSDGAIFENCQNKCISLRINMFGEGW